MNKTNHNAAILTSLALFGMLTVPGLAGADTANLRGGIDMVTAATNDAQLEKNVERALLYNMGTDIFALDVDVMDGMVAISGGVDLPLQIDRATTILNSMGVTDVANNLVIKSALPEYLASLEAEGDA